MDVENILHVSIEHHNEKALPTNVVALSGWELVVKYNQEYGTLRQTANRKNSGVKCTYIYMFGMPKAYVKSNKVRCREKKTPD